MTDAQRIADAEEKADRSRQRLIESVQDIAAQLEPRRLARELWEDAKVKGADLAEEAVDAVKARPVAATGVAAALAMFLAREPIADLASRMWNGKAKKKAAAKKDAAKPTPKRRASRKAAAETTDTENDDD